MMMSTETPKHDDIEAFRSIVNALEPFDEKDRDKILRWACEKLGIIQPTNVKTVEQKGVITYEEPKQTIKLSNQDQSAKDIKIFLAEKSPKSNNQLAAAVAYYHMFEAPINERKTYI